MSNFVPEGWSKTTLSKIAKLTMGQSPSSDTYNVTNDGLPFFQGNADFGSRYPKVRYWCNGPTKIADEKSILFSVRAPVGEVNITLFECCIGRGLAAIKGESADQEFLFQSLQYAKPRIQLLSQGSTFEAINGTELKEFDLTLPPLPEQQKIATILSSVDEVIEKTRAQIDKLKDLKTGMMQELLTKGIGHTEFKDSPVGRIPAAWTAKLLDSLAKRGSGHTPSKTEDSYWNGGVKWISLSDSGQLDNLYIHKTKKEISELGLANSSAVLHPAGIVVMARDAGIGKSAITTCPMAVSQHFMAWLCGDRLDNYFLYYLLQYWKPEFENIAMGSTIKTIGLPYFRTMMIPVPPMDEQVKISSSLKAVDETLFSLNKKSDAARKLKKALMQDLLTGKVRVTPNELAAL